MNTIIIVVIIVVIIVISISGGVGYYLTTKKTDSEPMSSRDSTSTPEPPEPSTSTPAPTSSSASTPTSSPAKTQVVKQNPWYGHTYWTCKNKKTNSTIADNIRIWWGHTNGDATGACNSWLPDCEGNCEALSSSRKVVSQEPNKAKISYWKCMNGGVEVANNIGIWWGHDDAAGTWACNEWVKDKCKGDCVAEIGVKPDFKFTECFEITGGLGSTRIEDTPTAKMVINKCFDEGYPAANWEKCDGNGYKIRGVCGPVIFGVRR